MPAVLAIAGLFRFFDLEQRGLVYWDEAKFALEGIRIEVLLQAAFGAHVSVVAGKAVGTAKPTHALFLAAGNALFGVHDYTPLLMQAAASVAGVGLTYVIAVRLFCEPAALLASLLLAVSQYDVLYARSALSESDATALFLAAVLVWLTAARSPDGTWYGRRPRWWAVPTAGSLLGLAFTANYRMVVYAAALIFFDAGCVVALTGWRKALPHAMSWLAGFAVVPICWQVVDLLARARSLLLFRSEGTHAAAWYLQEAAYQLHQGKQSVVNFNPLPYLEWYIVRQGIPATALALIGLALAFRRRTFDWLLPLTLVVLPYCLYITAPFIVPRNLVPMLPFLCILAAAATLELRRSFLGKGGTVVTLGVVALALIVEASLSWKLSAERSGYARAAAYLSVHHSGKALVGSEVMVFYLRGEGPHCDAPRLPASKSALGSALHDGFRYAVLDRYISSAVDPYVRDRATLVARFPAVGEVRLGENIIGSENSNPPTGAGAQDSVEVYDLTALRLRAAPAAGVSATCNRDLPR